MRSRTRDTGFTIIELLMVVAILAVVVAFAVPSYQRMIVENRVVSQVNQVSSFISFARSEAAKYPDSPITLCPSADNQNCSGGSAWESGWIILLDNDGDRQLDAGDGDRVLRVVQSLEGGNTLRTSGFTSTSFLQFAADGQPKPAGALSASAGTFIVCDDRGASSARAVVVMVSGQIRSARDGGGDVDDIVEAHDGGNITCP